MSFHPGQRYISESEPELGLGSLTKIQAATLTVHFAAASTTRTYTPENAPLRRVRFHPNDLITLRCGTRHKVASVLELGPLLAYQTAVGQIPEEDLADTMSFTTPRDRLLAGTVDTPEAFTLRRLTWEARQRLQSSEVYGFCGPRLDLIPHQLYVAHELAGRIHPRALLADEVGLGKTIEAGLVLHRLLLRGLVRRVLILCPEPLVNQWFVEMYRKFNLWFTIIDAPEEGPKRARAARHRPEKLWNSASLVLCSLPQAVALTQEGLNLDFDLMIVDEAHHLRAEATPPCPEYLLVRRLAATVKGVLLLTATPAQTGERSHFERLRLLDPQRFRNYEDWCAEQQALAPLARIVRELREERKISAALREKLQTLLPGADAHVAALLAKKSLSSDEAAELSRELNDRHGTSRAVFRNTRQVLGGFPNRRPHLNLLEAPPALHEALAGTPAPDSLGGLSGEADTWLFAHLAQPGLHPKVQWLAQLLQGLPPQTKLLVICSSRERAEAIAEGLLSHRAVRLVLFHEGLPLAQRDRHAAYFANPEGARVLIASEIGSEGRNFQFCQHLVLFDLPVQPGLLEQRIGRLDRIGQTGDIHIHIPCFAATAEHLLLDFLHQGLQALSSHLPGAETLLARFQPALSALMLRRRSSQDTLPETAQLLAEASAAASAWRADIAAGRDVLLEVQSCHAPQGRRLARAIAAHDQEQHLTAYLEAAFDLFGVAMTDTEDAVFKITPGPNLQADLAGLDAEGMLITFERRRAIERDELRLITWEHPFVQSALDLVQGSERGNASFALWQDDKERGLYLEALFILEPVLPPTLQAGIFLPPTPLRTVLDHQLAESQASLDAAIAAKRLVAGAVHEVIHQPFLREKLLPALLKKATKLAEAQAEAVRTAAIAHLERELGHEIARLRQLALSQARPAPTQALEERLAALRQGILSAPLRLDALRLVFRGSSAYFN